MPLFQALLAPFLSPGSRTYLPFWVGSVLLLALLAFFHRRPAGIRATLHAFRHPSTHLDVQLLFARQLLRVLGWLPEIIGAYWIASRLATTLNNLYRPTLDWPPALVMGLYTLALFIAWDASRYLVHLAMHRVPVLWAFHQVHHSAERLTPLTFHRLHPVESLIYQTRGALVTGTLAGVAFWLFGRDAIALEILGVGAIGLLFNSIFGNLRHSHVWLSFGRWERWFISPAQHQLHHGLGTDNVNLGSWLAVWDRLFDTWEQADEQPTAFGIVSPNHGHRLLSAWVGPFIDVSSQIWAIRRSDEASPREDPPDPLSQHHPHPRPAPADPGLSETQSSADRQPP